MFNKEERIIKSVILTTILLTVLTVFYIKTKDVSFILGGLFGILVSIPIIYYNDMKEYELELKNRQKTTGSTEESKKSSN